MFNDAQIAAVMRFAEVFALLSQGTSSVQQLAGLTRVVRSILLQNKGYHGANDFPVACDGVLSPHAAKRRLR